MPGDVIDYDSPQRPYQQLAAILARRIETGEIHSRLPGERALAAEYGTAVVTVRRALAVLREQGIVRTEAGWGTFVIPPGERGE